MKKAAYSKNILVAAVLCIVNGCATSPVADSKPIQGKVVISEDRPFPVLEKGMPADLVRQKLGEPAEIKPMPSPAGTAEVWVYHLETSVGMTQVATGMKNIPVYSVTINGGEVVMAQEPVYTTVAKKSAVTMSLLIFNGELTAQKAVVENTANYNN